MANMELVVDISAKKALQCLYDTAKDFSPEQLSVDELLMTLFLQRKEKFAMSATPCQYFFVISSESDSKCKISITFDFRNYAVMQFLSEFLKAFSAKLR